MLMLVATVHAAVLHAEARVTDRLRSRLAGDGGQSTAEYALVLLGAAGVALLLIAWAGRTDRITRLLNTVLDRVLGNVR